jgi:hypothetical protein
MSGRAAGRCRQQAGRRPRRTAAAPPPRARPGLAAISSGPTPAGSPSDTASGAPPAWVGRPSVVVDDGVAAQIAQIGLRALVDALVLQLRLISSKVGPPASCRDRRGRTASARARRPGSNRTAGWFRPIDRSSTSAWSGPGRSRALICRWSTTSAPSFAAIIDRCRSLGALHHGVGENPAMAPGLRLGFRCPWGTLIEICLSAEQRIARIGGQHLALVDQQRIEKPPRTSIGPTIWPGLHALDACGQFGGSRPREPSPDRRRPQRSRLRNTGAHSRQSCHPGRSCSTMPLGIFKPTARFSLWRRGRFRRPGIRRCPSLLDMRFITSRTSSSDTLTKGWTLRRSRRCHASSPRIWRLSELGEEPIGPGRRPSPWDPGQSSGARRGHRSARPPFVDLDVWLGGLPGSGAFRPSGCAAPAGAAAGVPRPPDLAAAGGDDQRHALVDIGAGDDFAVPEGQGGRFTVLRMNPG